MAVKTQVVADSVEREAAKKASKGGIDRAIGQALGTVGKGLSAVNPLLGAGVSFVGEKVEAGANMYQTEADNMLGNATAKETSMKSGFTPGEFVATDSNRVKDEAGKDAIGNAVTAALAGGASRLSSGKKLFGNIFSKTDEFGISNDMLKPGFVSRQKIVNESPELGEADLFEGNYKTTTNSFKDRIQDFDIQEAINRPVTDFVSMKRPAEFALPEKNVMDNILNFNVDSPAEKPQMDGFERMKLKQQFYDEMGITNTEFRGDEALKIDAQFEEWLKQNGY